MIRILTMIYKELKKIREPLERLEKSDGAKGYVEVTNNDAIETWSR